MSPSLIRCAKELREAKMPDGNPACLHSENIQFIVGDEDTDIFDCKGDAAILEPDENGILRGTESQRQQFDLVVAMEVLEHLPNAEEVAKKL